MVSSVERDNPLISVSIVESLNFMSSKMVMLWLDPQKGFMITKIEEPEGRARVPLPKLRGRLEVLETKQIQNIWIPTLVSSKTPRVDEDSDYQEDTLEVKEFEIGKVTPDDFKLTFPPGTDVIDTVNLVHYAVRPDGAFELKRFLNENTGVAYEPGEDHLVAKVDGNTNKLYTQFQQPRIKSSAGQPAAVPLHPAASSQTQIRLSPWIIGLLLVCTGGIVVWHLAKRWKAPPP